MINKTQISELFPNAIFDEPMKAHTTFRIGGGAKRMAFPATMEEMTGLLSLAEENGWSVFVVGNDCDSLDSACTVSVDAKLAGSMAADFLQSMR